MLLVKILQRFYSVVLRRFLIVLPASRTSTTARLLGEPVDKSNADRASRLMRGRVAMLIEDMVVVGSVVEGMDLSRMTGRNANRNNKTI